MVPGQIIADRFEIERQVGAGGMGTVCRALDRETGRRVAVKVLHSGDGQDLERFSREARVLSELRHPGIVGYVAHGTTEGAPYLVMEWLEGEDLSARLKRGRLTIEESLSLVRRAADALAVAHGHGVVHRDIKPANLFLCDRQVERLKLIDFGIARLGVPTRTLTHSGAPLGTPGYMAPEQARGLRNVDARADVFSLGCVLFKCLTGQRPFVGEHVLAVLAKLVLEDAPRVGDLCPEVPDPLCQLVARMLSKKPEDRPADAAEVAMALDRLSLLDADPARAPQRPVSRLTAGEQQILAVLLVGIPHGSRHSGAPDTDTMDIPTRRSRIGSGPSLPPLDEAQRALRAVATAYGAHHDWLLDGTLVLAIAGTVAATDHAARAARCALAVRDILPDRPSALAMGRGQAFRSEIVGEAIERAVRLVRAAEGTAAATEPGPGPIALDELTAGLLDDSFDVARGGTTPALLGMKERTHAVRTLLKKPTPCVGRTRELGTLDAICDHCVGESAAQAVLVDGAEGVGKSRVRYEFLRRLRRRDAAAEVWMSHGNPMAVGAPFGMLTQALRRGLGLKEGEPDAARRLKLHARLALHLSGADLANVYLFLGQLLGVSDPVRENAQLRAARQDAVLMGDQMRWAFEVFLGAECRAHPVVLVLEDLQWGDTPTVEFIDAALRALEDLPLMVLALARPGVHQMFPNLWASRAVTHLHIAGLSSRASTALVRSVLGDSVPEATVTRLVERAAGNAFYLEELIRAAAEGREDSLPDTVLAMVQTRLNALPSEARRVLRAASVFGRTFWQGGVAALLGVGPGSAEVAEWLSRLVEQEVVAVRAEASFPGEREYAFRHSLVREAAYGTLLDEDRVLGHALAGEWLERAGVTDAVALAEHFERGARPDRAIGWYRRAAEQALEGNEFRAVLARAERGIACGAEGEVLGRLELLRAEAARWMGAYAETATHGLSAMRWLPSSTAPWLNAAGEVAIASGIRGETERLVTVSEELCRIEAREELSGAQIVAWARVTAWLFRLGLSALAEALVARINAAAASAVAQDPAVLARVFYARANLAMYAGDLSEFLSLSEAAAVCFERAGMKRNLCVQRRSISIAYLDLGLYPQAEETCVSRPCVS